MQNAAAFNNVVVTWKYSCIKNVKLLELNVLHLVVLRFSGCIRQAVLADVYGRDLRIFVAAGVDHLVSGSASGNQDLRPGVGCQEFLVERGIGNGCF